MTSLLRATLAFCFAFTLACTPSHRVPVQGEGLQKPLTADWNSLSAGIFVQRCIPCHNPKGQARFLDLSTRENIIAESARLFDFENPQASYLIEVIRDPLEPMPPKTSSLKPLEEDEVQILIDWIAQGLP